MDVPKKGIALKDGLKRKKNGPGQIDPIYFYQVGNARTSTKLEEF